MIYLDTSAFAKLVWQEKETPALESYLTEWIGVSKVSSALLAIEARRAVLRVDPSRKDRADLLLTRVGRIGITSAVVESASRLPSKHLRSLDAIHLASALLLQDQLDALVTYDARLAAAAVAHRLSVVAPGV